MLLDIRPDHLQIVQAILQKHIPEYEVWAFGSRAKWKAKEYSDLDLCVITKEPLSFTILGLMAEDFSESDLPWKVDVVDWSTTNEAFQKIIEKDKVVIQKGVKKRGAMTLGIQKIVGRVSDNACTPEGITRQTVAESEANVGLRCADSSYADEVIETVYGELPSNLKEAKLSTICEKNGVQTGPFGSQLHKEDYVVNGTPIITVEHLGENRIIHENLPRISDEDRARLSKYQLKTGDIVFSRVGSVDRRALVQVKEDGWLFSGRCLRVRPIQEIVDSRWLSYFFGLPAFKNFIRGIAVGATMPSLNTTILSDIPIYFPPLDIQKSAAKILINLDDRIALLRETKTTLEAIAQALFKSWFVDFDPIRAKQQGREPEGMDAETAALFPDSFEESELGLVPSGWRVGNLGDEVSIAYGKNLPTKNLLEFGHPVFGGNGQIGYFDRYLYKERQVLISCRGAASGKVNQSLPKSFVTNNSLILETDNGSDLEFCYLKGYMLRTDLSPFVTGSAQPQVTIDNLKNFRILVPPTSIIREYQNLGVTIEEKIDANQKQAQTLATLRDTLLPRLISGQLRLPEASPGPV